MSKTILVAQREYLENVRTKTFWLGILAGPVIFLLAFAIGQFFKQAKDVRQYAILDLSDDRWLSKRTLEHAAGNNLQERLRDLMDSVKASAPEPGPEEPPPDTPPTGAQIRNGVREAIAELEPGDPLRDVFEIVVSMTDEELDTLAQGKLLPSIAVLGKYGPSLRSALAGLEQLDAGRYKQVPIEDIADGEEDPEAIKEALKQKVTNRELFAYFVIDEAPLAGPHIGRYASRNQTDTSLQEWFESNATQVIRDRMIADLRVDNDKTETVRKLLGKFRFQVKNIDDAGEEKERTAKDVAEQWAPVGFVYLLWIAIFSIANMLLTNTIEEKSNRIIEVLLSSVSPGQLMAGKIWGIGAVGMTLVVSWVVFALIGVTALPFVFENAGSLELGSIISNPVLLGSFVGYFLSGYVLYAAILVSIGSVCNSLKEAQNLMQPVMILLIVPLVAMTFVARDPNGTVARALSYFPPFTPFVMMNRAAGNPPLVDYVVTGVLLLATLVTVFWLAGRVFRIGVLMTGNPPSVGQIIRWMFQPEGGPRR